MRLLLILLFSAGLNAQYIDHYKYVSAQTCPNCSGTNLYSSSDAAGKCGSPDSTADHSAGIVAPSGTFATPYHTTDSQYIYEGTTSLRVENTSGSPQAFHHIRTNNHTIAGSAGNTVRITGRYYVVSGSIRLQIGQSSTSFEYAFNIASPTTGEWVEFSFDKAAAGGSSGDWRIYFYTSGEVYYDCLNIEVI